MKALNSPEAQTMQSVGYTAEYFATNEMTEYAKSGAEREGKRVLQELVALARAHKTERAASYYVYVYAEANDPQLGDKFQQILDHWLNTEEKDSWTPFLMFYLGRGYFTHGKLVSALPLYVDLRDKYREPLLAEDAKALAQGSGGYFAETLSNLANIYLNLGLRDRAADVIKELASLVPNDVRLPGLQRSVDTTPAPAPPAKSAAPSQTSIGRLLIYTNAALLAVGLLCYFTIGRRSAAARRSRK